MNYVFFDIDGTLHKEDIFLEFLKFSLRKNLLNSILFFPILFTSSICYVINPRSKFPLNIILYFIFLGSSKKRIDYLINSFSKSFLSNFTQFKNIVDILELHLENENHIVLISGSPTEFIKKIYGDLYNNKNITVIGSETKKSLLSFFLKERCIYKNKRKMLEKKFQKKINFSHGYSDSLSDIPILELCKEAFIIQKDGSTKIWEGQ